MTSLEQYQSMPFLELGTDGKPLVQLKFSLVFYLGYPPGPRRSRLVYDEYMARFGNPIRVFQSTSWLGPPSPWSDSARSEFEERLLPAIQQRNDWGYAFSDGSVIGGNLFMFHGYRPVTEQGKASFFRFEWPWDVDVGEIEAFASRLAETIPFDSGTGGYIISARPTEPLAFDRMFALCSRFWGLEAWDLDVTVRWVLDRYKCPSWLTLIGSELVDRVAPLEQGTRGEGLSVSSHTHGAILRSRSSPSFIDRNRNESFSGEQEVAELLYPVQVQEHGDLSGPAWRGRTMDYLRRFYRT